MDGESVYVCVVCMLEWFYYGDCRGFPLLLSCYWGLFVTGREGRAGGAGGALLLFLSHYIIIIIINIIAVLLLALQLFSF